MAYLDLSEYSGPAASIAVGRASESEAWHLSDDERQVVLLAEMDGPATLGEPRPRVRLAPLFRRRPQTLADPRLEALRQYVVAYRAGLEPDELSARTAGFSAIQLHQARRLVSASTRSRRGKFGHVEAGSSAR